MAQDTSTRYPFNGLGPEQFFILLLQAAQSLRWQMGNRDKKYTLKVPPGKESNSEVLLVSIENGVAVIEHQKNVFGLGRKNDNNNALLLVARLNELRQEHPAGWLSEQYIEMMARQRAYEKDIEERAKANKLTPLEKIWFARGAYYVTYSIIGVNVLLYLIMAVSTGQFLDFHTEVLVKWGGMLRYLIAGGQWYRLITAMFLHAGLIHLAFNMYALYCIGTYLEPLLGRWRYMAVYLACGVFASLATTWWHVSENVGIGASGAIFGMFGFFLALLTTNYVEAKVRKPILQNILFFVVLNIALGAAGNIIANIDNVAHIGGLVSGILFGYLYYFIFISRKDNITASIIITLGITIAAVYVVLPKIKDDTGKFMSIMERFDKLEAKALVPVEAAEAGNAHAMDTLLKTVSLPAWQQCSAILDSTDSYIVADYYNQKKEQLKKYVNLQITHTNLLIQYDNAANPVADSSLSNVRSKIKLLVDSLTNQ